LSRNEKKLAANVLSCEHGNVLCLVYVVDELDKKENAMKDDNKVRFIENLGTTPRATTTESS